MKQALPDTSSKTPYRGRFAPSPTGPLHAGSVMAALASYLDAKANNGSWHVRIEDLDPPRESPAAVTSILNTLDTLGLHWDGEVVYQSKRHAAYQEALEKLDLQDQLYYCTCTRQDLVSMEGRYPGTCRDKNLDPSQESAIRCRVNAEPVCFQDSLQGEICQCLQATSGDFVVRRKDGFFAYQLAVVVDDGWQNITHVVRGIDLLDSTPRQIQLQQLLGLPTPRYTHIPVVVNAMQQKLSKQHMARPVELSHTGSVLLQALDYLQQDPDPALEGYSAAEILAWAQLHWHPEYMQQVTHIQEIEEF